MSTGDQTQQNISRSAQNIVTQQDLKIRLLAGLLLVVCAVVLAAHWPALSARAMSFDDRQYLTDNLLVQNPGWTSARRFLTEVLEPSTVRGYYQPLAMISLMVDYALGGRVDNLMPFHRTSLVLHAANTALIIVLLYLLFGRAWIAAGVGLLFGLHPMTVEPIPWVSDRKTLLAAFFALWCLVLYVRFARKSRWQLYIGCMVMYVLALMSKPTSTPLPMLMLLIDFWPLRRLKRRSVLEKLPFFVVGGIFAIITYISQSRTAVVGLPGEYSLWRIPLVLCHNIIFYLYKIVWPVNLSSHYAYPVPFALSESMVLAGVIGTCILVALLVISLRWTRGLMTGWLVFFVAILPTMQIISFSDVIASDKFAYLPSVGLLMVLAALLGWFCSIAGFGKAVVRKTAVVIVLLILAGAETIATQRYLLHWRDTVGLYKYMLTLTPNAALLHNNLGMTFQSQGRFDEAVSHFRLALQIRPDLAEIHNNLGGIFASQGRLDEAISHYHLALRIEPDSFRTYSNLGNALAAQGKFNEAISHYNRALQIRSDFAGIHNNLGNALRSQGKFDEAIGHYRQELQLRPDYFYAHTNLGVALAAQGKLDDAISHYRRALRAQPDYFYAHYNIGVALAAQSKFDDAISHYRQALQFKPDYFYAHNNLANALLTQGKPDEAIKHYNQLLYLKPNWPMPLAKLAWLRATHSQSRLRNPGQAVNLAERAAELTKYQDASILDTLAAAYAAAGRFDQAVTTAKKAFELVSSSEQKELIEQIQSRLRLYKAGKPYTELSP